MSNDFFPPRPASTPTIYAYDDTNPLYAWVLKVKIARLRKGLIDGACKRQEYRVRNVTSGVYANTCRGRLMSDDRDRGVDRVKQETERIESR